MVMYFIVLQVCYFSVIIKLLLSDYVVLLVFSVPYSEVFRDRFFSIGIGEPA